MTPTIRTAIIGLGARGLYFAQLYDRAGFELRALCDCDPQVLEAARARHGDGAAYFRDVETLLREAEIDAVIVTTSDPHHVEPTLAALRAGKHVLVEKPLCQSVAEAQKLVNAARDATGIMLVGFELRECIVFRRMKQFLDEERIGEVKLAHCFDNVSAGGGYFFHDPSKQSAFFKSLLLQKATHSLDLLNWFVGSVPVAVYGTGGRDVFGGGRDYTGREVESDRHCGACPVAADCPYFIDAARFRLDYGATVQVADACVWRRDMDLNDNAQLAITYQNGVKATFQECHFTPDYTREFTLIGTRGKMTGFYDNEGRFSIRIDERHAADARSEEWKPASPGGGHGGGDEALRAEFQPHPERRTARLDGGIGLLFDGAGHLRRSLNWKRGAGWDPLIGGELLGLK